MRRTLCAFVVIAFLLSSNAAIDCKTNRCTAKGKTHTMCRYPNQKPAAACGKVTSVGFNKNEQQEIVNTHNKYRQFVAQGLEKRGNPGPQPAATNMETISWDDELASVAQRWANQCNFGHDSCRDVDRFSVGQNIGKKMTTGVFNNSPSDFVKMWYEEVQKMDRNQVHRLTSIQNVGHYTQLVWAKTNRVGCGKIIYQNDGKWKNYYVVCNYGPAGNFINQEVYKTK